MLLSFSLLPCVSRCVHSLVSSRAAVGLAVAVVVSVLAMPACAGPRNIILMIGDGMGPDCVAAAGAWKFGAAHQRSGGTEKLALETLAQHRYVMTFSAEGKGYDFTWNGGNREYPKNGCTDSAAAATAMATGVKTYNAAIGVNMQREPVESIVELAARRGLKTGLITTVQFCHATPAGFAAHDENRNNYTAIAHDMLFETVPDVVMGGGNPDAGQPPKAFAYLAAADWQAIKDGKTPYRLVQTRDEFRKLADTPATGKVLGLFQTLNALTPRNADGAGAAPELPTLAEMTRGALNTLANPNGFFLMVEGGAIDWGNHGNDLNVAVGELLGFDEAVTVVLDWIAAHGGWDANLLIITADHETGYLNSAKAGERGKLPTVTWGTDGKWGGHTNRLVDLYCQGAGSETLASYSLTVNDFERGKAEVIDNTAIFWLMRAALPSPAR